MEVFFSNSILREIIFFDSSILRIVWDMRSKISKQIKIKKTVIPTSLEKLASRAAKKDARKYSAVETLKRNLEDDDDDGDGDFMGVDTSIKFAAFDIDDAALLVNVVIAPFPFLAIAASVATVSTVVPEDIIDDDNSDVEEYHFLFEPHVYKYIAVR